METKDSDETGLVPGTTSEILWHFTGGPPEINGKRTKNKRKPDDVAFDILKKILKSGFLKPSKETVKFKSPKDRKPKRILSFYCCCVAEIPIQHLHYHADWYGKSALGFRRHNLKGTYWFRPVHYTFDHDDWAIPYATRLDQLVREIFSHGGLISKTVETSERVTLLLAPKVQLRFIKSFNEKDFGTIYCEREWGKIHRGDTSQPFEPIVGEEGEVTIEEVDRFFMGKKDGFKFKPEDVSFIVCPSEYTNELALKIRDDDNFKKYFGIPVVAFEDLLGISSPKNAPRSSLRHIPA